jgi:hypothetical protein
VFRRIRAEFCCDELFSLSGIVLLYIEEGTLKYRRRNIEIQKQEYRDINMMCWMSDLGAALMEEVGVDQASMS